MRSLAALEQEKKDVQRGGKKWVEPLRVWVLDTKQATDLGSSNDLHEISNFVRKFGTNPIIECKSMQFSVPVPSQFAATRRAQTHARSPVASVRSVLSSEEVLLCEDILTYARTHFARAERVVTRN